MSTKPFARIRTRRPVRTTLTTLGTAVVLVAGIDGAGYAATGNSLLLGKTNHANRQTTVVRTTSGPVLSLKGTSATSAPLAVNGTGLVTNLNADLLDGLDASAFARAGSTQRTAYVVEKAIPSPTTAVSFTLPVPDGSYEISYTTSAAGSPAGKPLACDITLANGGMALKRVADAATLTTGVGDDGVSASGVLTKDAGHTLWLNCTESGGAFTTSGITPIQVVLRPLDVVTAVAPG